MLGYCLIDTNNIGFAAQAATRLNVGGMETQAIYGVLRVLQRIAAVHGHALRPIALWDGRSWRKDVYTEYKANRDANDKMTRLRDGYKVQRPFITKGLKLLGFWQMIASNMEADDLAGILVRRFSNEGKKVVLISGDRDWQQLVGPSVTWHDPIRDIRLDTSNFAEVTGFPNPQAFLQGKALQGDAGDNIPGVGGIGEKGAKDLIAKVGFVQSFLDAPLLPGTPKKFADFHSNATGGHEKFARNMRLMNLLPSDPPIPKDLKLLKGELDAAGFEEFCNELAFKSITSNLEGWLQPLRNMHERLAA